LYRTFYGATSFTGDGVSNWDTSRVTSLSGTFYGATSFTGDGVSNWDTSRVTSLSYTFSGATSFTGDGVSNWDTSSVTTLYKTFEGATSFTGDGVSNWDTSKVTDLSHTFYYATSFTVDGVSNWNTSKVISLDSTFQGATSFTGFGVSNWDTSSVTSLVLTFYGATSFAEDISQWNVRKVALFYHATTFHGVTLLSDCAKLYIYNSWSNVNVDNSWAVVCYCTLETSVQLRTHVLKWLIDPIDHLCGEDINTWNISGLTDLENVFMGLIDFNGNISNWDTSSVTSLYDFSFFFVLLL